MPARYATRADLELFVPGVANIPAGPPDPVEAWLEATQPFLDVAVFGEKLMLAHMYYTLHFLSCEFSEELGGDGPAEAGPVNSLSAGPETISAGYAVPTDLSSFSSTIWGRKYLQISCSVLSPYVVG